MIHYSQRCACMYLFLFVFVCIAYVRLFMVVCADVLQLISTLHKKLPSVLHQPAQTLAFNVQVCRCVRVHVFK